MKSLGVLTASITTIIASTLWKGYVLSKLWLWFVAATFGAQPLGVAESIGLSLIITFTTHQFDQYEDKNATTQDRIAIAIGYSLFYPAFALFIGWIVKAWL